MYFKFKYLFINLSTQFPSNHQHHANIELWLWNDTGGNAWPESSELGVIITIVKCVGYKTPFVES